MLTRLSRRLVAVLGMALLTGGLVVAAPGVASADSPTVQRFYADSGDACGYGLTAGHFGWHGTHPVVDVRGTVYDNPVDNTWVCRDDGRFTVANFTAYSSNNVVVDRGAARADNGANDFAFTLGVNTSTTRIHLVVVQICRYSPGSAAPDYCGPRSVFDRPTP
jgi:hypothetical protein